MHWLLLSIFVVGILCPVLTNYFGRYCSILLAILTFCIFIFFVSLYGSLASSLDGRIFYSVDWFSIIGVKLNFLIDSLSLIFALLITGIGALIIIYSGSYLSSSVNLGRFLGYLLAFMGSMLGLVLSNDVITLFVFWEATSLTSFLLIGFNSTRSASRRAALQALIVTGGGGLALLLGLILLSIFSGSYLLSDILSMDISLLSNFEYILLLVLILFGAFTKSAQFPFHFWLPNAMEAPTPVSAYLHSATMVKAGIYLLMRLSPLLSSNDLWFILLSIFGGITLLLGGFFALMVTDLKRILAYSTMASLGLIVMLLGVSSGSLAAILYLVSHSFFKGSLFMLAGVIDHSTGSRDIEKLSGLRRFMPISRWLVLLSALSMCGIPPFIGFVAKEVLYTSLSFSNYFWLLQFVALIGNALMFCVAYRFAIKPFHGVYIKTPRVPREGNFSLLFGSVILASFGLLSVIFLSYFSSYLILPAAKVIDPLFSLETTLQETTLHLWSGFNFALFMSILTFALGYLFYIYILPLRRFFLLVEKYLRINCDNIFDFKVNYLSRISFNLRLIIQNGNYNIYISVVLFTLSLVLFLPFFFIDSYFFEYVTKTLFSSVWNFETIIFLSVVLICMLALVGLLLAQTRLMAIISLGIQGLCVALIFMFLGAPDLSFTQFMIETLSVVILALVMTRLSVDMSFDVNLKSRWFSVLISIFCGLGIVLSLSWLFIQDFDSSLSTYFSYLSYLEGHGRNIVNVIIVDFRALDTLGEISVVMAAGISCIVLLRMLGKKPPRSHNKKI